VFGEEATCDWTIIGDAKELTIHGAHLGPRCYPRAIALLADKDAQRVAEKEIVSDVLPLESFLDGINMVNAATKSVKVALDPFLKAQTASTKK
jgi:hypothetical protein